MFLTSFTSLFLRTKLREAFKKNSVKFFTMKKEMYFFLKLDHYLGTFGKKTTF